MSDDWADTGIHFEGDSWNDTGNNMYGCLKQLNLLKRRNRNLKVLLSIGGWTYSSNFKAPMSTPSGRTTFVKSAVGLLSKYGFDGIDVDWEYPQNADEARNYVELLGELRHELDAYSRATNHGYHFEMSVACPAGAQNYRNLDIAGMDRYLDFWNLMAYDFAGAWDQTSGHHANLYPSRANPTSTPFSAIEALEHYVRCGVRPDKLVLGMPLYGHAFENTDGIGKPYSGVGEGTWENGIWDYKKLPLEGSQEVFDREAQASYCYHHGQRKLISYDTPGMAGLKAGFIQGKRLGGAMWWESSADKPGRESLIATVVNGLGGRQSLQRLDNCIEYPHSQYDNLRNGFPNN